MLLNIHSSMNIPALSGSLAENMFSTAKAKNIYVQRCVNAFVHLSAHQPEDPLLKINTLLKKSIHFFGCYYSSVAKVEILQEFPSGIGFPSTSGQFPDTFGTALRSTLRVLSNFLVFLIHRYCT